MNFELEPYGSFVRVPARDADALRIPVGELEQGVHQHEDILFRVGDYGVEWVVSRTCDHAQGKLFYQGGSTARCPLHNWVLDLESLCYQGVGVTKKALPFQVVDDELIVDVARPSLALEVPDPQPDVAVTVRFLAHASVALTGDGVTIVTDPWLFGPCFSTGWWHAFPAKADALDIVNQADAVYISHNHPDHLHPETLDRVRRDMPMLVPSFESDSVASILRDMGFTDIRAVPFNKPFRVKGKAVTLSVFQAGDFRDDSGLFVQFGKFSALLSVDANRLNSYVLPKPVDLLMTSFASGASGFPLCFDVFEPAEQDRMVIRNRHAVAAGAMEYMRASEPKYYVPYAGFFTEAAARDSEIKARNRKNSPTDMVRMVGAALPHIRVINPIETDLMVFDHGDVTLEEVDAPRMRAPDAATIAAYETTQAAACDEISDAQMIAYFEASGFQHDLILYVQPTDDAFAPRGDGFKIDFQTTPPTVTPMTSPDIERDYRAVPEQPETNTKYLRIRRAALCEAVRDGLPWENMAIGFQCRVHRKPNVYNAGFWYHFTNTYVGARAAVSR